MEQSQFIALTMNAFQLFRTIVPIDTGNMRYSSPHKDRFYYYNSYCYR